MGATLLQSGLFDKLFPYYMTGLSTLMLVF